MKASRLSWTTFAFAAFAGAACDQISVEPKAAQSATVTPEAPPPVPDLRAAAGQQYSDFAAQAGMAAYTAEGLELTPADKARFEAAMAVQAAPAWIASGGGAEALVFAGCATDGCDAGRAVLAIDVETGAAFLGAVDGQGAEALAPNPRLEALLRLSSPSRAWEDLPLTPGGATPSRR